MSIQDSHILVIDDAPENIRELLLALRAQPWRITLATTAEQGYHRAQALVPDLILLDVRMPGMDGFALCRLLQELPRARATPILFLTSASSAEERLEGLNHGAVDYILKSCDPAEIIARVQIHLRLSRRGDAPDAAADVAPNRDEAMLRAAMRLIGRQLSAPFTLEEIAAGVGTYDKRLSAIFRQQLGMTVFAWIREERLRKSRELLADTSLGMQEIAENIGFRSACNFTTAFRERLGVTPSEYRKAARQGAVEASASRAR
ncbi:response regulator transcription factor [Luteibacter yeojuensis]|uniref:Response regulator transcription factor n=1 Tax=Luteibacter yeojuensis TaxID=345309 RepID=A0A7X5QSS6_9GAMM|nr:response regulator [Luteibacter yeojuensis]NID14767.1 response regulator transcription factor [Luteibacter yeojuensis]